MCCCARLHFMALLLKLIPILLLMYHRRSNALPLTASATCAWHGTAYFSLFLPLYSTFRQWSATVGHGSASAQTPSARAESISPVPTEFAGLISSDPAPGPDWRWPDRPTH